MSGSVRFPQVTFLVDQTPGQAQTVEYRGSYTTTSSPDLETIPAINGGNNNSSEEMPRAQPLAMVPWAVEVAVVSQHAIPREQYARVAEQPDGLAPVVIHNQRLSRDVTPLIERSNALTPMIVHHLVPYREASLDMYGAHPTMVGTLRPTFDQHDVSEPQYKRAHFLPPLGLDSDVDFIPKTVQYRHMTARDAIHQQANQGSAFSEEPLMETMRRLGAAGQQHAKTTLEVVRTLPVSPHLGSGASSPTFSVVDSFYIDEIDIDVNSTGYEPPRDVDAVMTGVEDVDADAELFEGEVEHKKEVVPTVEPIPTPTPRAHMIMIVKKTPSPAVVGSQPISALPAQIQNQSGPSIPRPPQGNPGSIVQTGPAGAYRDPIGPRVQHQSSTYRPNDAGRRPQTIQGRQMPEYQASIRDNKQQGVRKHRWTEAEVHKLVDMYTRGIGFQRAIDSNLLPGRTPQGCQKKILHLRATGRLSFIGSEWVFKD